MLATMGNVEYLSLMKILLATLLTNTMLFTFAMAEKAVDPLTRLEFFSHSDAIQKSTETLINELDSESYAKRIAAYDKLTHFPALPEFVRQLAKHEKRPEVRSRLKNLTDQFTIEHESDELNRLLKLIHTDSTKGVLAQLTSIVQVGKWHPDTLLLHDTAQATVLPSDLPLIALNITSQSADVRRLMASTLAGLPLKDSLDHLKKLLNDSDEKVRLTAAHSLAQLKHKSCLPALARLLSSSDFYTRHQAWSALKGLSGQSFDYDPSVEASKRKTASAKWLQWSSSNKARISGKLPEKSMIQLFNGQDLSGWDIYENGKLVGEKQTSWKAANGQLQCLGVNSGEIRTQQRFKNYVLTLDFKIDQNRGDGGIGLMLTKENEAVGQIGKYLEVQLLPGNTGDLYSIGNFQAKAGGQILKFRSPRIAQAPDPIGKWNKIKITVKNGSAEIELNGILVNEVTDGAKGLSKITLRNEGHKIAYRNMSLIQIEE